MNRIFGYFLSRDGETLEVLNRRKAIAAWFIRVLPESEFESEECVLHHYLAEAADLDIGLHRHNLRMLMTLSLQEYLHKSEVHVTGTESLSFRDPTQVPQIVQMTFDVILDCFDTLVAEEGNLDDFPVAIKGYFDERRRDGMVNAFSRTMRIISGTESKLAGMNDALRNVTSDLAKINTLYSDRNLTLFVQAPDRVEEKRFITDSGLPTLDRDTMGIFTKELWAIDADAGMGKTRFVLGTLVYRALTIHMRDVLYYALEQERIEIENMLIAHHVLHMFDRIIEDQWLTKNMTDDKDVLEMAQAARFDLFESGKYGKLRVETESLELNSFVAEMTSVNSLFGPFDLVVLDYIYLMRHIPQQYQRALNKAEIIQIAYQDYKRWVRLMDVAGIAVNQLNAEGSEAAAQGKKITSTMVAGGMEAARSADYEIAITATPEMEAQNKRRLSNVKKRATAGIGNLICTTILQACVYTEMGDI